MAGGTGHWSAICDILYRTPEREGGTEAPVKGAGKTPGKAFGNIFRNNLKLWRITLWYLAEEHSRIGCPHFSMTFSMMTSDISAI